MRASKGGGPEWDRLGKLLEQSRVEMDPRWRDLTLFARERGLNWRLAWDAENNRRTTYRSVTRTAIEVAYGWQPGSIDAVLAGGQPVKANQVPARILALIESEWGSMQDAPQHVREFAEAGQFPEEFRMRMIQRYIDGDPGRQRGSGRHLREA